MPLGARPLGKLSSVEIQASPTSAGRAESQLFSGLLILEVLAVLGASLPNVRVVPTKTLELGGADMRFQCLKSNVSASLDGPEGGEGAHVLAPGAVCPAQWEGRAGDGGAAWGIGPRGASQCESFGTWDHGPARSVRAVRGMAWPRTDRSGPSRSGTAGADAALWGCLAFVGFVAGPGTRPTVHGFDAGWTSRGALADGSVGAGDVSAVRAVERAPYCGGFLPYDGTGRHAGLTVRAGERRPALPGVGPFLTPQESHR